MPSTPKSLYTHTAHPHTPRNVNAQHAAERLSVNDRIAIWVSAHVGTMACAYIFAGIGIGSLVGVITGNILLGAVFGSLSSYFLQLVLLPVIMVGQNVSSRHAELQADEMFATSQHSFADIEQIATHLTAQDTELLKQTTLLLTLLQSLSANVSTKAAAPLPSVQRRDAKGRFLPRK